MLDIIFCTKISVKILYDSFPPIDLSFKTVNFCSSSKNLMPQTHMNLYERGLCRGFSIQSLLKQNVNDHDLLGVKEQPQHVKTML